MLNSEIDILIRVMTDYWGNWKPNPGLLAYWRRMLLPLDYATAAVSVEKHFGETNRVSPMPARIKILYDLAQQARGGKKKQTGYGYADLYIECVVAPPGFPNRLGRKVPVYFGNDKRLDQHEEHYHDVMKIADQMRQQHETLYGGQWRIIEDTLKNSPFRKTPREDEAPW